MIYSFIHEYLRRRNPNCASYKNKRTKRFTGYSSDFVGAFFRIRVAPETEGGRAAAPETPPVSERR